MWFFSHGKQMTVTHRYNCAMSVKVFLQFQHMAQFAERTCTVMVVSSPAVASNQKHIFKN